MITFEFIVCGKKKVKQRKIDEKETIKEKEENSDSPTRFLS